MKNKLIELLCDKAFKYSDKAEFKLASGKMSHFYINCKPVILNPEGMFLVGHLMFEAISNSNCDGVGGLTFGADPIAVATSFASHLKKQPIKAFSIRKELKDHGVINWVEGDMSLGEKVVIIDDVATTGGSTIKAVERAIIQGLNVIKVVTLIDRQEGGLENIGKHVDDVSAIITKADLMAYIKK